MDDDGADFGIDLENDGPVTRGRARKIILILALVLTVLVLVVFGYVALQLF